MVKPCERTQMAFLFMTVATLAQSFTNKTVTFTSSDTTHLIFVVCHTGTITVLLGVIFENVLFGKRGTFALFFKHQFSTFELVHS